MSDFIIRIIADPSKVVTGSKVAESSLKGVENAADKVRSSLNRAFTVAAVGIAIKELIDLADAYTLVQNRLGTVTSGQAELASVTEQVFAIANRTRQAFESTAEVYTRIGASAQQLGRTQEELLQFTESLNQAVVLSGAAAQEASAGMIQLSQGLSSGALRGDELRSVLEQLPAVADVIAKHLGVTRGELRKFGEEGKITANVVLDAFKEAREELDERFAKTVPTVAQSFTVLRNNVAQALGELNAATGTTEGLSSAILVLAENVETVGTGLLLIGTGVAAIKLAPIIAETAAAASAFVKLRVAVVAGNAVTLGSAEAIRQQAAAEAAAAQATAARTAALLVQARAEATRSTAVVVASEAMFANAAIEKQLTALTVQNAAAQNAAIAANIRLATATKATTIASRLMNASFAVNPFLLLIAGAAAAVVALRELDKILGQIAEAQKIVENPFGDSKFGAVGDQIVKTQKLILDLEKRVNDERARGTAANPQAVAQIDRLNEKLAKLRGEQEKIAKSTDAARAAADAEKKARDELNKSYEKTIQSLNQEGDLLTKTSREREIQADILRTIAKLEKDGEVKLTEKQREAIEIHIRANAELKEQADILDALRGPQEEFAHTLELINGLHESGIISTDEHTRALQDLADKYEKIADLSGTGVNLPDSKDAFGPEVPDPQEFAPPEVLDPSGFGKDLEHANDVLDAQADILESIIGPQRDYATALEALDQLQKDNKISAEEYNTALLQIQASAGGLGNTLEGGLKAGLAQAELHLTDVAGAAQDLVVNAFGNAEDAIVDFAVSGEFNLSSLVDSVLADLTRLLLHQAFQALLPGSAGGAGGGGDLLGGLGSFFSGIFGGGKAEGGPVEKGTPYLVGEEGQEIFTPSTAGTITPAGETAAALGGGAKAPIVNVAAPPATVNVYNVSDPTEIPAGIESPEGEQAVLNVMQRNKRRVRSL